jgi:photosystem II stability/assembly factor-like uncharacterized protein
VGIGAVRSGLAVSLVPGTLARNGAGVRVLAGVLVAVALLLVARGRAEAGEEWTPLVVGDGQPVRAVAPAPGWPTEGPVLVSRADALLRSADGGATWERLPRLDDGVATLAFAPGRGSRTVFATTPRSVLRSLDAGATWASVLEAAGAARLAVSPEFDRDRLLFALDGGALLRSRDGGGSWERLDPAPGQLVQQVVFSPGFATDRTVFLAAASGGFPGRSTEDQPGDAPSHDHELSAGVLVSRDGGASWTPSNEGIAWAGTPYRHVQWIAVSPTFGEDGTVFALGWGPRLPGRIFGGGTARLWDGGLFRSTDRGTTWHAVASVGYGLWNRAGVGLALSPSFAADGVAVLTESSAQTSPASANCRVRRSGDGGSTWNEAIRPGSYEGCGATVLANGGADLLAFVPKGTSVMRSSDGGLTWGAGLPGGAGTAAAAAAPGDASALVGSTTGDVWRLRAVAGDAVALACPATPVHGFGRVWATEAELRFALGCPRGPERAARIRVRPAREGTAYWTEDDDAQWHELFGTAWVRHERASTPWPGPPEEVVDGAVQRFAGGMMLWLPRPDGRRTILVLSGRAPREVAE